VREYESILPKTGGAMLPAELRTLANNFHDQIESYKSSAYNETQLRMNFIYEIINPEKGEALAEVKKTHVEQLPIPVLDFSKKSDKVRHDKLVALVDQMLDLKKKEQAETLPQTKTMLGRQIQAVDRQIDTLVYELYGLTEDEIRVVEGER
jgi:hypothetical protein